MKPLIGITSGSWVNPETGWTYNRIYTPIVQSIERAGGVPVAIPTGLDEETLRALYMRLEGVLLPGGGDVDPKYYGELPHPKLGKLDPARDEIELMLVRWAVHDNVPLFGICRGHQVLNVALGGTLVQDLPSERPTALPHDQPDELPRNRRAHNVDLNDTSRLGTVIGDHHPQVNSLHHQAVANLGPGVRVTAYSPDGVIEGLEIHELDFALSVQWHPEDLAGEDAAMLRLFASFIEAANNRSH
ncbi:MAG: gamma-glutamyl-gamma-aminobutyrate hydrolase family protein [Anaerolineae bacterium]|nr:gamma-glutamyl-gamma-aminobutyrate hydrolase family protein [Anaerolineae bacterium]